MSGEGMIKTEDRIKGCLAGGAMGDALGYPVEHLTFEQIVRRFGNDGITQYCLQDGKALISDDTQLSLFTANGVLNYLTRRKEPDLPIDDPCDDVMAAYVDWLKTQGFGDAIIDPDECWLLKVKELFAIRNPGATCIQSIGNFCTGKEIENNSKGCGGLMRTAPHAMVSGNDTHAASLAKLTHLHPLGYMPSFVLNHILVLLLKEKDLSFAIEDALKAGRNEYSASCYWIELERIVNKACELALNDLSDNENIKNLGLGWVAEETLAIAIYCALRHCEDFSAGIIAAVNHDGDSDSTGSVTGNILGTLLGYDRIDKKWKENLELFDIILKMAEDLNRRKITDV